VGAIQYETFEHEADIGIRGFGRTVEEAFENAASSLYSVMVDVEAVEPRERREVRVEAGDPELLLLEWLNGLLALSDIERMVFSRFQVRIAGSSLEGEVWGEQLDLDRHRAHVEVKAATLHMLRVAEEQGRFVAQCVVDV
jgi:SHS2 domain-containing protein